MDLSTSIPKRKFIILEEKNMPLMLIFLPTLQNVMNQYFFEKTIKFKLPVIVALINIFEENLIKKFILTLKATVAKSF